MALTRRELETFYRDLEVQLYNFALRWVFDHALAEEVMHEAFVRVWKVRETVIQDTVKGLLYKTVQNLALNELRRRRVRESFAILKWFDDDAGSNSPESNISDQQNLAKMRTALEKLPHELREVLLLSHFSDLSYAQIAETLEIAEGTVASRKSRALSLMREYLNVEESEYEKE